MKADIFLSAYQTRHNGTSITSIKTSYLWHMQSDKSNQGNNISTLHQNLKGGFWYKEIDF